MTYQSPKDNDALNPLDGTDRPSLEVPDRVEIAQRDLAFIRTVMEKSRAIIGLSGLHLVSWGLITGSTCLAHYAVLGTSAARYGSFLWPLMVGLGWLVSHQISRREYAGATPCDVNTGRQSVERLFAGLWATVGIGALTMFVAAQLFDTIGARSQLLMVSSTMWVATFMTGHLSGIRWISAVSFGWLAFAIYVSQLAVIDRSVLLIMAAADGLLIVMPGLLIERARVSGGLPTPQNHTAQSVTYGQDQGQG
ncbi:MAG: hypothetical protein AAGF15_11625 [Pseudomonadota bacterium]